MAPVWQSVGICDGGCGQVLALSADRQTLVHYGDTHGAYMTTTKWAGVAAFMDQWQSIGAGLGAQDKFRQGVAVIESTVTPGTWFALTGDAVANAPAHGGGVLAYVEAPGPRGGGEGGQWTLRSTAIMGAGNHNAAPLGANWRCTGHLLVMEPSQSPGTTYLWGGGHGQGIQRAACTGAASDAGTWVRCQIAGSATGTWYVRALAIDPGNLAHVYASLIDSTGTFTGVYESVNAHAATPNFTKLASQPSGQVHDLLALGGFLYAACGTAGIWRMDLSALTWANLNGGFVAGSPSLWTAVGGAIGPSGNHVIWLGNFNPQHTSPAPAHDGCAVSLTGAPGAATGAITYADLPAVNHGTVPVPAGATRTFWRTQAAWLGGTGFFAPFLLPDPADPVNKVYATGSAGPCRRVNGTEGWTIAYNGYDAFLGHPVWASKATAGLGAQGDSDWGWIWWSTPTTGPGAGYPAWDASSTKNQTDVPPGGPEAWSIAGDYYNDDVYAGTGNKYTGGSGGGLGWRPGATPGTANWTSIYNSGWAGAVPMGLCVARDGVHDATGNKVVIAGVSGKGVWRYAAGAWAEVDGAGGEGAWGPSGANRMIIDWQPGTADMVAYDHVNGIFYSTDLGLHWYLLWSQADTGASRMARFHPANRGEVWVSNASGVYKITNAHLGAVGSGAAVSAAYPVANNGPLRWAPAGVIDATRPVLVVAQDDTGNGSGVQYTKDGGATWLDAAADKSFRAINFGPEDMDIGHDGVIYISGSNVVAFGYITQAAGTSQAFTERQQSQNFTGSAGTISLWNNQVTPPAGGAATLAGSALFAEFESNDCAMTVTPSDTNWVLVAEGKAGTATGQARAQLWAYLNAPAGLYGDATHLATWTYSNTTAVFKGKLYEGTTPAGTVQAVDQAGGAGVIPTAPGATSPVALSAACAASNNYTGGLTRAVFGVVASAATAGQSWAPGTGWTADGVVNNLTNTFQMLRGASAAGVTTATDTVTFTGGGPVTSWAGAVASFYAIPGSPPVITTTTAPNAPIGVFYTLTLGETGGQGPFTWGSAGTLPPGLTLNTSTGVISGTPTTSGTYPFTVTVTGALGQSDTQALSITVPPLAISVRITTSGLPPGTEGATYQVTLTASGGRPPDTWLITGLPPGLTYDPATGTISGIPAAGSHGDWPLSITVTDSS